MQGTPHPGRGTVSPPGLRKAGQQAGDDVVTGCLTRAAPLLENPVHTDVGRQTLPLDPALQAQRKGSPVGGGTGLGAGG